MWFGNKYGVVCRCSKTALAGIVGIWLMPAEGAQAEPVQILALGDSLTQGYGLPQGEGFVPQLQSWLEARGHDVIVINGGVSGDTTAGGLSRVEWSLTPDVGGMIVTLGGNDLLRGIDPAASRANIDGILQVAEARDLEVLLVGMVAPGNFGAEYKTTFDALYPELSEQYGTLYAPSFFTGLVEEGQAATSATAYMQPDGIHPNAEGVTRIVEDLGPRVEALLSRMAD